MGTFRPIDSFPLMSLHAACRGGEMEQVEALLASSECDINEKDESGWSPLHCALSAKHYHVATRLLRRADISVLSVNRDLSSPLHYAVRQREPLTPELESVIDSLLSRGKLGTQTGYISSSCEGLISCFPCRGINQRTTTQWLHSLA